VLPPSWRLVDHPPCRVSWGSVYVAFRFAGVTGRDQWPMSQWETLLNLNAKILATIFKMSCFWDGILRSLELQDFYYLGRSPRVRPLEPRESPKPLTARQLANFLKNHNRLTTGIRCNDKIPLRAPQLQENFDAIAQFDVDGIYEGYLCSTSDPFLCLVSFLFEVEIQHDFNGVTITYSTESRPRRIIRYRSDSNHFWYG
jgi:hypothetical protein